MLEAASTDHFAPILERSHSFFATFPLEYLHHDDRINPRSIGSNIRGLIEEFLRKRPQLHVALAWWAPDAEGAGLLKVFDGQHKAAAQILLGTRHLPLRVFVEPDTNVLLQANTNAGGKLRQVAFDAAVMRHLGSSLYVERVKKYQSMRGLQEGDYSFSEKDLVRFFSTHAQDNRLLEFVEWAGKSLVKPLSYSTIEKTFFKELLCKKALDTPIELGMEEGTNPRLLEREQLIRLMSLFADVFFVGRWDPDLGGRRLEHSVQSGKKIPESHLLAWRIAREEVMANVLRWVRLVVANYNAYTGQVVKEDRLFQVKLTDALWERIRNFLVSLSKLPCWIDKNLANTVFGPKQNADYWETVFQTGKSPTDIQILAAGLDLNEMIATKLPSSEKNI